MNLDPARRRSLNAIKLAALARDHGGDQPGVPVPFEAGAALSRADGFWVLADHAPTRALGAALALAQRTDPSLPVRLLVDDADAAALLTRRAAFFTPAVQVARVDGREARAVAALPYPAPSNVDPRLAGFAADITAAGADVLIEHGVLVGEVLGLEVCRAVFDPHLDVARLEVGVGAHDREAFQMLHGDRPTLESLRDVATKVRDLRHESASPHPLKHLAAERAIRNWVLAEPSLVGAHDLRPADPPVVRTNLKDPVPCVAVGTTTEGQRLVVVCSSGIDTDLVPFAADARGFHGAGEETRLVLVIPPRDRYRLTEELVALLSDPADIVTPTR